MAQQAMASPATIGLAFHSLEVQAWKHEKHNSTEQHIHLNPERNASRPSTIKLFDVCAVSPEWLTSPAQSPRAERDPDQSPLDSAQSRRWQRQQISGAA